MSDPQSDYTERFGGIGRLYGKPAMERLRRASVLVVGLGGVGSWAVEGLARSGVGALTLVDLDDICVTNVNRQLHALDGQIGRAKGVALAERVRAISPECRVVVVSRFFTETTADEILAPHYDGVVDAIDSSSNKALLIARCVRRGLPCVTAGGAGGRRDPTQIRSGDLGESGRDPLLKILKKRLRRDHGFPKGEGVRFGVRCVYSQERPVFPWADGLCRMEAEPGSDLRLDCESGFGTGVFVTGAFGLAAAGELVAALAAEVPSASRTAS